MLKILLILILLLVIVVGVIALKMSFRNSDEEISEKFKKQNIPVNIEHFQTQQGSLRYMSTGNDSVKTAIVFIHGAPGGMDMFNSILMDKELRNDYFMVSVDRLGYGYSEYGKSEISMEKQAKSINELISTKVPQEDVILFAHSFGAPIASYIPMLNSNVKNVILAGGAVSPNHEKFELLAWLSNSKALRWIASNDTKVASDEKLSHVNELKKIYHIWNNYPANLYVMHGTDDWLVPYGNLEFLKENVPADKFIDKTLKGKGHLFISDVSLLKPVFEEITFDSITLNSEL